MCYHQEKVQYLRIILTNRCNLNCYYCHKEGIKEADNELTLHEIIQYTRVLYDVGIRKIKLMGGEPTLRNDLVDVISGIRKYAIDADISLITNGILIKDVAQEYIKAGLNRINVSIHGWNHQSFYRITQGSAGNLEMIKSSVLWLKKKQILTKINFVIQKGINEAELIELIHWCTKHKLTLDVLNMLYNSRTQEELKDYYYDFSEIKKLISTHFEIASVKIVENNYSLPSTRLVLKRGGQINLKTNKLNNEFAFNDCENCQEFKFCSEGIKAIRLTNRGIVKPCLFRDDNTFNLRDVYEASNYNETIHNMYNYIMNL